MQRFDVLLSVTGEGGWNDTVYKVVSLAGEVDSGWRSKARAEFRRRARLAGCSPSLVVPMYAGSVGQFDHLVGRAVGYSLEEDAVI